MYKERERENTKLEIIQMKLKQYKQYGYDII